MRRPGRVNIIGTRVMIRGFIHLPHPPDYVFTLHIHIHIHIHEDIVVLFKIS